jgi:archaeal flagellin FlaB
MFEPLHSEEERGQVGIGTLIVFIAMVLVAAIAAGVLINTAGSLQSQASDTGTETQQAVANQVEVVHAYGETSNGEIDEVHLVVMKSAGSDVIDVNSMTVQYTSSETSETLQLGDSDEEGDPHDPGEGEFGAEDLNGDEHDQLVNTDDRIELTLDVDEIEDGLERGGSATVALVDQSGAQYTYGITVPATFDGSIVEV